MTTRFHGLTSLELIFLAITLAAVAIFMSAWLLGISYLVAGVAGLTGLLYAYCAKCPCRTHCGHVIPGKIVRSIFPHRQPGPYSLIELAVLGLALLLLLGLPQIWLWQFTGLFLAFWLLTAIALIQIRMIICRTCDNIYCPARLRQG